MADRPKITKHQIQGPKVDRKGKPEPHYGSVRAKQTQTLRYPASFRAGVYQFALKDVVELGRPESTLEFHSTAAFVKDAEGRDTPIKVDTVGTSRVEFLAEMMQVISPLGPGGIRLSETANDIHEPEQQVVAMSQHNKRLRVSKDAWSTNLKLDAPTQTYVGALRMHMVPPSQESIEALFSRKDTSESTANVPTMQLVHPWSHAWSEECGVKKATKENAPLIDAIEYVCASQEFALDDAAVARYDALDRKIDTGCVEHLLKALAHQARGRWGACMLLKTGVLYRIVEVFLRDSRSDAGLEDFLAAATNTVDDEDNELVCRRVAGGVASENTHKARIVFEAVKNLFPAIMAMLRMPYFPPVGKSLGWVHSSAVDFSSDHTPNDNPNMAVNAFGVKGIANHAIRVMTNLYINGFRSLSKAKGGWEGGPRLFALYVMDDEGRYDYADRRPFVGAIDRLALLCDTNRRFEHIVYAAYEGSNRGPPADPKERKWEDVPNKTLFDRLVMKRTRVMGIISQHTMEQDEQFLAGVCHGYTSLQVASVFAAYKKKNFPVATAMRLREPHTVREKKECLEWGAKVIRLDRATDVNPDPKSFDSGRWLVPIMTAVIEPKEYFEHMRMDLDNDLKKATGAPAGADMLKLHRMASVDLAMTCAPDIIHERAHDMVCKEYYMGPDHEVQPRAQRLRLFKKNLCSPRVYTCPAFVSVMSVTTDKNPLYNDPINLNVTVAV